MANVLKNTAQVVANKVLMEFINSSGLARMVDRQFEKKFGKAGAKIGASLDVYDEVMGDSSTGQAITTTAVEEKIRRLTLNQHLNTAWSYSIEEDALSVDGWMERHGKPRAQLLANRWDIYLMKLAAQSTGNYIGTPATAVAAWKSFGQARAVAQKYAAPPGEMLFILDPDTQVEAVDLAKGLFNSQQKITNQYESGNMGQGVNGGNWHMTQNVYRHTIGALGGTPLVKGASQLGASINTDGWTVSITGVLKKGDSITFASSYGVNPITKETLPDLKRFAITADVNSDGSGEAAILIDPPIILSGPYQNVSVGPADNDIILIFGNASSHAGKTSADNLVMSPMAITAAVFPLPVPSDAMMGATAFDEQHGVGVSVWRASDIRTGEIITRLDFLGGATVRHPEWITRLLGA